MNIEILKERYKGFHRRDIWINEALFGYKHIKSYLDGLRDGERVLEVGSGSGILLSIIKQDYPHLLIEGIEPLGEGFSSLSIYHDELEDQGVIIHHCGYEALEGEMRYKLIFLVNVFEHLPDWRDFLGFVKERISEDGICVMLFPNYGLPYESHVRIPIIINPKITYHLFKNKIKRYEEVNRFYGIWDSLNFVRFSSVRKQIERLGLQSHFDTGIVEQMINRLDEDKEFYKRQRTIALVAKFIKKFGLLQLFKLRLVQDLAPYIKLEIRHRVPRLQNHATCRR